MSFSVSVSRFEMRRICSSTSGDEVLRLVDEQHDLAVLRARLEQEAVQRVHVVLERGAGHGDVQVLAGSSAAAPPPVSAG